MFQQKNRFQLYCFYVIILDSLCLLAQKLSLIRVYIFCPYRTHKIHVAWTGLNDRAKEGDYRWDRFNSLGGYKRWCKGEPNQAGNEDGAELFANPIACLNDKSLHQKRFFICEANVYKTLSIKTV